jgi:dsDNA-specific endonuclease/ATPase MutS2
MDNTIGWNQQPQQQQMDPDNEPVQQGAPTPADRVFTQADLDAALAQERAKLTPQVSKADERWAEMQNTVKELTKFKTAAEKRESALEQQRADAAKAAEEAELSAAQLIEKRSAEWQARIDAIERQRLEDKAIFDREREFQELRLYTTQAVDAVRDQIEPRLLDYISGTTREEVDASIQLAIQKTEAIGADIRDLQTSSRAGQLGVRPGPPPVTQFDAPASDGQLSAEDIAGMSMADYVKFRQGRIPSTGQGLFG